MVDQSKRDTDHLSASDFEVEESDSEQDRFG